MCNEIMKIIMKIIMCNNNNNNNNVCEIIMILI